MPHPLLKPALILIGLATPVYVIVRVVKAKRNQDISTQKLFWQEVWLFLFFLYAMWVLSLTLMPDSMFVTPRPNSMNFVPVINTFHNFYVVATIESNQMIGNALENILGNIVLFFPLGIMLPITSKKYNTWKKILVFAFIASFSIEFFQFVWGFFGIYRSVDIDDVILNTLGALIGYFFYYKFSRRYATGRHTAKPE